MTNPTTTNTAKVVSGQPVKDNGATVIYGGTADGKNVTQVLSSAVVGYHSGKHGSVVPSPVSHGTDPKGVSKAISANAFATMTAGKYVGKKYTGSQQAVSLLESGAADFGRRSIHLNESRFTSLQISAGWNYVTGQFLSTPSTQTDSFGSDHAARPTRAVPGELQYTDHSMARSGTAAVPKLADYEAKTN